MAKVIQFAETISNALGKIFGWRIEIDNGGIANDFEDAAMGSEDMADSLGDSADSAKQLRKELSVLPFDELNQLNADKDTGSTSASPSGSTGGGAAGTLPGLDSNLVKTDTIFERYKSSIDSLYELGDYIGSVLTKTLNKINWDKIYDGARRFGTGLADFLNGLISPETFGAVGRTIAGALNTAIYAALSFGQTFEWKSFGESLAASVNEFFSTFDFGSLAETINVWVKGILDTIISFIDRTDWEQIGTEIGEFLADIDFVEIGKKIGQAIWKAINAGFSLFEGMFESAPLETALVSLVGITKLLKTDKIKKFGKAFKNQVSNVGNFTTALFGSEQGLQNLRDSAPKAAKVISGLRTSFTGINGNVFKGLNNAIGVVRDNLTGMQKGVITTVAAVGEFAGVQDSLKDLITGSGDAATNILELGVSAGTSALAMYTALGPAGLAVAAVTGLIAAISGIDQAFEEIRAEKAMEIIGESLSNPGGVPLESISESYQTMFNGISEQFGAIIEKSQEMETTKANIDSATESVSTFAFTLQNGGQVTDTEVTNIIGEFERLLQETKTLFNQESDVIMMALAGSLGEAVEAAGGNVSEYVAAVSGLKSDAEKEVSEIETSIESLTEQYQNNEISLQEYTDAFEPLWERYQTLRSHSNDTLESVKDFNSIIEKGINLDEWKKEDGTFDLDGIKGVLNTTADSAKQAKQDIQESSDATVEALQEAINRANALGDSEKVDVLSRLMETEKQNTEAQINEIDRLFDEYTGGIQTTFLEAVPEILERAETEYDKLDPISKLFNGTKGEYVQSALNDYQTNVINPLSDGLVESYRTLGSESEPFIKEVGESLVDGLFVENPGQIILGKATNFKTEAISGYKDITNGVISYLKDDMLPSITKQTENVGKDSMEGVNKGVKASDVETAVKNKILEMEPAAREALDSHSPSRVFESVGKDAIAGLNLPFTSSYGKTTIEAVKNWLNSVLDTLKLQTVKFKDYGREMMESLKSGIEGMSGSIASVASTIQRSLTQSFNGIGNSLYNIGRSAGQSFANGFSSIHVPLPHLSVSGWISQSFGNGGRMQIPNFRLDWYKQGGLFDSPTVIGVGEAGREVVLPLDNPKTMRAISESLNSSASRAGIDASELQNAVAAGYAMAMMNNQNSTGQNPTFYIEVKTENDEVLARAVTRGQKKLDYRNNPTPKIAY